MASRPRPSRSSSRPVSPQTSAEVDRSTPPADVFATNKTTSQPSSRPSQFQLLKRAVSTPPEKRNESVLVRSFRGAGTELSSASDLQQSWDRQLISRKRSQYYESAFAYREASTARARVTKDSLVTAEVRLNCKVRLNFISAREVCIDMTIAEKSATLSRRSLFSALRNIPTPGIIHHGYPRSGNSNAYRLQF